MEMNLFRVRRSSFAAAFMVCCLGLLTTLPAIAATPSKKSPPEMKTALRGHNAEIVAYINKQIKQGWDDNEIKPSDVSEDVEWLRRVSLDLVGHIPSAESVESFLKDKDQFKRSRMVEKLLEDPGYVRNFTTIWTNLTIGRRTPRRVSRYGMSKFLREAFARNRPWNRVVYDIVSAEGHFEENGAVNYLLAQMVNNDDAVQMTAKTTRLFMGVQVQCTQCHNHPFNDWKQNQFWEFNSFFRQTRKIDHRKQDPKTGRRVDDYSEIVSKDFSGPVYYEKRSGLMKVAYPKFFGEIVEVNDDETDRRKELARLMAGSGEPWVAKAMVNRMWGQLMGYGFTKPVDDMGPHNPASHPELLDYLTAEFVASKYDVKQLIRWICNSQAYSLSSRLGKNNHIDNPAAGETPLFSHMYVKSMQAEQLYDSLIIATNAHKSGQSNWGNAEKQRQRWMQQFVVAFDGDENDEATTFNGTIPQALMMMNGELVNNAISTKKGGYLRTIMEEKGSDTKKINKMYLSTLGRLPKGREKIMATRLIKGSRDKVAAYQDLYWALLNSNAFIFNY